MTQPLRFIADTRGATSIEFGMTAPIFFVLFLGIVVFGLLLWTQSGLQHGVEMAARCVSIDKDLCGTPEAAQTYAAKQSFGLKPTPATFAISQAECGTQVVAVYKFNLPTEYFGLPAFTLQAQSCFPS